MRSLFPLFLLLWLLPGCGCSVVEPGHRGIKVSLGEVTPSAYPEGLVWHAPLVSKVIEVSIQQQTRELIAECYSSDLQQVNANLKVLYRLPEENVVALYQQYAGNPFEALVAPRVAEAIKEITALQNAESIVKNREKIKVATLEAARLKVGDLVSLEDIVIENVSLSAELEAAIESKMVQQQEAAKAEFTKQKAKTEAETAVIRAQGEADAIKIRGAAIRDNPSLIDLQIAEKWDGKSPLVVGSGQGANILLPVGK